MNTILIRGTSLSTFTSFLLGVLILTGAAARAQDIVFVSQPVSQGVALGSNATFSVSATGTQPISYQWQFNASGILDATNSSYTITDAQGINHGAYDCVLTNITGSVTSQVAQLVVFTTFWTGGGDGTNWNNASNWSGGTLPGTSDDVLINAPGNVTITNTGGASIRSLVCQANLASGGSLTVSGSAQVFGSLTLGAGASVQANGGNASFVAYGPASADGASFYTYNGGLLTILNLTNYNATTSASFEVGGIGSVLNLPALTQINGPNTGASLVLDAYSGGYLNLGAVTNIVATQPGGSGTRSTQVIAYGLNSFINLSNLVSCVDLAAFGSSYITSQNEGSVALNNATIINGPSLYVSGGSTMTLPKLNFWDVGAGGSRELDVEGIGSVLNLPALTQINGPNTGASLVLEAYGGGYLNLGAVTNIVATQPGGSGTRSTQVIADGLNSFINLSNLVSCVDLAAFGSSYITSQNGGSVALNNATIINGPSLYVSGGSTMTLPKLNFWDVGAGGSRELDVEGIGSVLNLPALTQINGPNTSANLVLYAYSGGYLNLGAVTNIVATQPGGSGIRYTEVLADGLNSFINLSNLVSCVDLVAYGSSYITSENGGSVALNNATIINGPSLNVYGGSTMTLPKLNFWDVGAGGSRELDVEGIGSVLNLPALTQINGPNTSANLVLYAYGGGYLNLGAVTNIVATQPGGSGTRFTHVLADGLNSFINLSNLVSCVDLVAYGSSYIESENGGSVALNNATIINGPSLNVYGGSTMTLPKLNFWDVGAGGSRELDVEGIGSVLNLPALTQINGPNTGASLVLDAYGGGYLNLGAVTNIVATQPGGSGVRYTQALADGIGSVINLSQLLSFTSPYGTSTISEQNGGIVLINPSAAISGTTYLLVGNVNPPNGAVGVTYSSTLVPLGGKAPFTWSLVTSNLPPGLGLSPSTGVISGTPTTNGVYSFLVQVTDSNGLQADAEVSLTINTPAAGFSATQSMPGYVTLGTNTVTCQISYPAGRQLYSLLWQPVLPPNWTLVSAQGDGSAELQFGQIAFTAATLPNPLNFTYSVTIATNQTGTSAISGSVSYWMNGMSDVATVNAAPNPLLVAPAKRHDADYEAPFWVIDGNEVSRPLAYWRAQAYQIKTNTVDGYTIGAGTTNGPLYTADFEAPFWVIDGTEINRILAYWRAGAYHPDTNGADGYAPGVLGSAGAAMSSALEASEASRAATPLALSLNQATVTQSAPDLYVPGAALNITNTIQYNGTLLSLLLRPNLPNGWALQSVSGSGSPQAVAGEIVWTGTIPPSPFQVVYSVQVPAGNGNPQQLNSELEYQFSGMVNPASTLATPNAVLATVMFVTPPVIAGAQVSFNLQGVPGATYQIQASSNLLVWSNITTVTATGGAVQVLDTVSQSARFYRAVLISTP